MAHPGLFLLVIVGPGASADGWLDGVVGLLASRLVPGAGTSVELRPALGRTSVWHRDLGGNHCLVRPWPRTHPGHAVSFIPQAEASEVEVGWHQWLSRSVQVLQEYDPGYVPGPGL